jgi:hypothetical protein
MILAMKKRIDYYGHLIVIGMHQSKIQLFCFFLLFAQKKETKKKAPYPRNFSSLRRKPLEKIRVIPIAIGTPVFGSFSNYSVAKGLNIVLL